MHPYTVNSDRLRIYVLIGILSALLTPLANKAIVQHLFAGLEPWVSAGPSFGVIYGVLFGIYNHLLWRWTWFGFVGLPAVANLGGRYEGKLISSYKGKTEIPLSLEIVQTWTKLIVYIRTGTDSSESYSYMASIFEVDNKSSQLTYTYTNEPFSAIADADMKPHDGTAKLTFRSDGTVIGKYFNARERIGTIKLTKQSEQ
ncbi:MAG TPA: hypothetical protein VG964_01770 [Candidatus Saccharimonadales bacterium]|nr:hypothetical protein [Candidatus Saccharimonadales bacterium]